MWNKDNHDESYTLWEKYINERKTEKAHFVKNSEMENTNEIILHIIEKSEA